MIFLKTKYEIGLMRTTGAKTASILQAIQKSISPGISTFALSKIAETEIRKHKCLPIVAGYRGFPSCICVSINDEIVHGIPNKKTMLKEGDIVTIDIATSHNGYAADMAATFPVGKISPQIQQFLEVTHSAIGRALQCAYPHNFLHDMTEEINATAQEHGYGVVSHYGGHGIGTSMHEDPFIPNTGFFAGTGPELMEGFTFTLEPMFTLGSPATFVAPDNWTVKTRDHSLAAHFEHTIAITANGPEILTNI